ncbi:MAG: hypothetical protein J7480_07895 [Microbacteriaceae bacterium]|nr:hypothetical protein [Microbacteriaceae bacterium]
MPTRPMATRLRTAVSVLVAAPVLAGSALLMSGCAFIAPQATLIHYDPADGISADLGEVELRNVQAVANEEGSLANVTFTAINHGEAVKLNYAYPTADGSLTEGWIPLAPGSTLVGEEDPHRIIAEGFDARVGGLLTITLQAGDADSQTLQVPLLSAESRPHLEPFVPAE